MPTDCHLLSIDNLFGHAQVICKNRLTGDGLHHSFVGLLIARTCSVGNIAYLMFSFNNNSDYKGYESGTKLPFVLFSRSPLRVSYMRTAFSVSAGMIKVKPTIGWLPRLSPQLVGSAPSDHYLDCRC